MAPTFISTLCNVLFAITVHKTNNADIISNLSICTKLIDFSRNPSNNTSQFVLSYVYSKL